MKRREALAALITMAASPLITSCSLGRDQENWMLSVEIWTDSNPDDFSNSKTIRLASADMHESKISKGLFSLPAPLTARLPSGLRLEVFCERVATGHFHVGISHNGELASSGKYSGPFTVRAFPADHSSYVLDVKVRDVGTPGSA